MRSKVYTHILRKWTFLSSTLGGVGGQTCRSYAVHNKAELSTLLEDETFGKADVVQFSGDHHR